MSVSPTTFAELIALPATQKKQLVEIELGERLEAKGFVQNLAYPNMWTISYIYEDFTLNNGIRERVVKQISSMKAAGIQLYKESSWGGVDMRVNSFWQDIFAGELNVNIGGDPALQGVLMGYFNLYFSSTPDTVFDYGTQIK